MHILILKGDGRVMNVDSYNCQELGLAKALVRKGFDVSIVMAGHTTENIKINVDGRFNINVYYRRYRALHPSLAWFEKVESLLCLLRPDFIQIHGFTELMSFRVVRWANKHCVRCNLIQGMYRPTQKFFFKQLEELFNLTLGKYIIKHVDSVGAKTPMAADYIRKYYNRQVGLTLIGLDTDKLIKDSFEKDWRQSLGLGDKKVLLYIGVLEKRRNPLFLVEITKRLPEDYVLLIVGDGPQGKIVNDYIQINQLKHRCLMLGRMKQNEVSALYKAADAFLLASDYEIYGMVILESMFFGVPVITTLTAGSEAIIDNNINGMILKEKNVELWCQEIIRLCTSDEKYRRISDAAKEKIEKELIWEKAADAFIAHYKLQSKRMNNNISLTRRSFLAHSVDYTIHNNLCLGCGVCKSVCPANAINIVIDHGEYRPQIDKSVCLGEKCGRCLKVCPGIGIDFLPFVSEMSKEEDLKCDNYVGHYKSLYTGHSCDDDVRYHSASGGMVTSFLLFLIDKHIIDGAIVTRYSEKDGITPEPFIARSREELIAARSSKYCPVSMERVRSLVNEAQGKFVVVGLPCHMQAFRKLAKVDSKFRIRVFGYFSIYCSSNRSFYGRDYLLKSIHVKKDDISYFAFRDEGCLGCMKVISKHNAEKVVKIPFIYYYGSIRSFFKPHRCLTCIDHYGELADVSFGDIHIKPYSDDHIGISSWIVRSNYWDNLFHQAADDGYIIMNSLEAEVLNRSQAGMLYPKKRRAKAVMTMDKILGRAIPQYDRPLDKPSVKDYISEIICHCQRFVGRHERLWWIIDLLSKGK